MTKPYYDDPKRQAKLEKAIKLGYIKRQADPDGVIRYILTDKGLARWNFERLFDNAKP